MRLFARLAVAMLVLALPRQAFALAMETFGNQHVVRQPDWADGVLEVVNLESRVYSYWVNGNESFFYAGNSRALNEALRKYASVQTDYRALILLPGPATQKSFQGKTIAFDWQLHVPSGIYKAVAKRRHAVMTLYVKAPKPGVPADPRQIESWIRDLESSAYQTREQAERHLQELGQGAKPNLRAALGSRLSPESYRRVNALLQQLPDLDVSDLEIPKGITVLTVSDLLAAGFRDLDNKDQHIRGSAIQELTSLASYSDKVVPAVIKKLDPGENEWVRRVAAGCLSSLGVSAKAAIPTLQRGLADRDANVQKAFQEAINVIEKAKQAPEAELKKKRALLNELEEFRKAQPGGRAGFVR